MISLDSGKQSAIDAVTKEFKVLLAPGEKFAIIFPSQAFGLNFKKNMHQPKEEVNPYV